MKKLFLLSLVLFISFQINAQQAKKFAIKSGKLVLELSGSTTGTKTIYFDDWGNKYYEHEKSVTEVKMFGITDREEKETTLIMNKDKYWTIDHLSGDNYNGTLAYYDMGQEIANSMTEAEQKQLADNILNSMGGQKLGTEDVIGFKCEKMTIMGAKSWIYKGIALRSEVNVMGVVSNEKATEFKPNIKVDASKFKEPSGISFEDLDAKQQALFGQMEMYEEEEDEEPMTPVTYPYEDFQETVRGFTPQGYAQTMVMNQDGQYMAIYNMGFSSIVTIIATSDEDADFNDPELQNFDKFTHKGRECAYGTLEEDGMPGKALFIRYPKHDMIIVIMAAPGKDKQTLLDWSDELDF